MTEFVTRLDAELANAKDTVAEIEAEADVDRQVAARKELISFLYKESHQYVVIIVAAAYAAYFTTLSTLTPHLGRDELLSSALLMTVSLTIFVLWEVLSITYLGWLTLTGRIAAAKETPRWVQIGWPIALAASLLTGLPAIALSLIAYLRGLSVLS